MSSTPRRESRGLLVVASAAGLRRGEDLLAAHAALRPVRTETIRRGGTAWRRRLGDVAAVILVADPGAPVAEVVEGTHVYDGGRPVPIGVLPDDPRAFAAAAAVQRRSGRTAGPLVVLASREDHVRERADLMAAALEAGDAPVHHLPSGRVDRKAALAAFTCGPGLVVYTGVGDARGWGGYGRIQSWELDQPGAEPVGALVSLSCSGSARLGSLHGLCESVVAHGSAACALGAVSEVPTADDERLGATLAVRLAGGATSLAEAIPAPTPELERFRISGDPLAPFLGAAGAQAALRRIGTPAAGDRLPPVSWSRSSSMP